MWIVAVSVTRGLKPSVKPWILSISSWNFSSQKFQSEHFFFSLRCFKTFYNMGNCDSKPFFSTNLCKKYLNWSSYIHECFKIVQYKNVCFQLNVMHSIIPKASSRISCIAWIFVLVNYSPITFCCVQTQWNSSVLTNEGTYLLKMRSFQLVDEFSVELVTS